jgi:hypothetical protein
LGRLDPEVFVEDTKRVIQNFIAANPDLARCLLPSRNQIKRSLRKYGRDDVFNLANPELQHHVQAVGAKWAYALHYKHFSRAIPLEGGAIVRWWSNANRMDGPILPPNLEGMLPPKAQQLRQGVKASGKQFEYYPIVSEDTDLLLNFITCSRAFAMLTVTTEDTSFFDETNCSDSHIHRPGHLLRDRIPMTLGWHHYSFTWVA